MVKALLTKDFTQLPRLLVHRLPLLKKLTGNDFRILFVIISKTIGWNHIQATLRNKEISEITGINQNHVNEHMKKLKNYGLIERTKTLVEIKLPPYPPINPTSKEEKAPATGV